MFEKFISSEIYLDNRNNNERKLALIFTSLIPAFLLFSRAVADVALIITGILFIIHTLKTKNYNFLKPLLIRILLLLWLWFMFSSFFASSNNFSSFASSFVYIRFILFFIACTSWLFTEINALKFAIKIITLTMLITICDSLWQFFTEYSITGNPKYDLVRLTSFLKRPNVGTYLLKLIFPITGLWLITININNKKHLFLSCSLLLCTIGVICITGERTATALALIFLIFSLFAICINSKSHRAYMIAAIICIISAFMLVLYSVPYILSRALGLINDVSDFSSSLYGQLFQASILIWQDNIFTGAGLMQFRHACAVLEQKGLIHYCTTHSHNIYLEILSETGAVGLILFVTFIILCISKTLRVALANHRDIKIFTSAILALSGLCIIFFPISVTMSFITNWSAILNWLGISLCVSLSNIACTEKQAGDIMR